jgi:hypothetical protein
MDFIDATDEVIGWSNVGSPNQFAQFT